MTLMTRRHYFRVSHLRCSHFFCPLVPLQLRWNLFFKFRTNIRLVLYLGVRFSFLSVTSTAGICAHLVTYIDKQIVCHTAPKHKCRNINIKSRCYQFQGFPVSPSPWESWRKGQVGICQIASSKDFRSEIEDCRLRM